MTKATRVLLALLVLSANANAEDDLWFDTGQQSFALNLRYGQYNQGGSLHHISARLPLIQHAEISLNHTQTNGTETLNIGRYQYTEEQSASSLYVQTDPFAAFTYTLGYENGSSGFNEQLTHWVGSIGKNTGHWFIEGSLIVGEDEFDQLRINSSTNEIQIARYRRTRMGLGTTLRYFSDRWALLFCYRDYTVNSSASSVAPNNDVPPDTLIEPHLPTPQDNRRSARRTRGASSISGPAQSGYQQIGSIGEREMELSVATDFSRFTLLGGYYLYEALLDEQLTHSVFLSSNYVVNRNTDLNAMLSASDHNNALYAEFGVSFHW